MGSVGDIQSDPWDVTKARYDVAGRYPGKVVAGIKPRPNDNLIRVIRLAEAAKAFMITVDIDSAGRGWMDASKDTAVEPKTVAQLRELVRATRIPILVKGIMTPDDALLAGEAGAAGICVSNHGGRVLDHTPSTAEVLPAIVDKVKGKMVILVDGCVHYGTDVLKYVALGADAVLVGRHLWRAAHGGGRPAVALFMKTMRDEMTAAMVLTAVPNVASISRNILA
jgi:isopentenyl diphosphate isomerase/L-lactate dehydrogenase-like FMN-dependent dehydrogenase